LLSSFQKDLFSSSKDRFKASQKQIQMVSVFLGGKTAVGAAEIAEIMYCMYSTYSRYSKPKAVHTSQNCPAHKVICEDENNMAQGKL